MGLESIQCLNQGAFRAHPAAGVTEAILFSLALTLTYYKIINLVNSLILFLKNFFFLFRGTPKAYGSFQARGQIRATAACLHHSCSQHRI